SKDPVLIYPDSFPHRISSLDTAVKHGYFSFLSVFQAVTDPNLNIFIPGIKLLQHGSFFYLVRKILIIHHTSIEQRHEIAGELDLIHFPGFTKFCRIPDASVPVGRPATVEWL